MATTRKAKEGRKVYCRICFVEKKADHQCDERQHGVRAALIAWGKRVEGKTPGDNSKG